MTQQQGLRTLVIVIIAISGLLPLGVYWYRFGRVPGITPTEARRLLAGPSEEYVLVDVRNPASFLASHLESAISWPSEQILAHNPAEAPPENIRGHKLLLICDTGYTASLAAQALNDRSPAPDHPTSALYVRGGMQEWMITSGPVCPVGMLLDRGSGQTPAEFPFRAMQPWEQWTAAIAGLGIKPVYMAISLVIAFVLRRQQMTDLAALRNAMILFFLGEGFCAINYFVYGERSYFFEYLHNFGMVLAFAYTIYALLEGLDLRLIRYSAVQEKCAALPLCRGCIKHADVPCGLRRMFLLLVPATLILAAAPLCSGFRTNAYNTQILGSSYSYIHEVIHQAYEIRFLPLLAIILLTACLGTLFLKERHPVPVSKALFAAGAGALGFSYFRLILLAAFVDNQMWFVAWEEFTEMMYVLFAAGVLWVFRQALFGARQTSPSG